MVMTKLEKPKRQAGPQMKGLIPLIKPVAWRSSPAPADTWDGRQGGDLRVISDGNMNRVIKARGLWAPFSLLPKGPYFPATPPHPTPTGRQQGL